MKNRAMIMAIVLGVLIGVLLSVTPPLFCSDYTVWVKSETCWVVREPSVNVPIVGIILQKGAVQVEDVGNGWLEIVDPFAPCRDPQTLEFIRCKGCYIRKSDTTRVLPGRW